jgi:hypothetical protein
MQLDVVREVADEEDAAAARLEKILGASGSARISGSKPAPWSRTRIVSSASSAGLADSNSTNTLRESLRFPA